MVFRSQNLGSMCVWYCGGCTSPRLSVDRTGDYLYICVDLHSHIDISVHKNTDLGKHFMFIFTSHCNMYVEICVCTDISSSNPKPRVHFNFPYYVRIKLFYDCDRSDSICKAFCCFLYLVPLNPNATRKAWSLPGSGSHTSARLPPCLISSLSWSPDWHAGPPFLVDTPIGAASIPGHLSIPLQLSFPIPGWPPDPGMPATGIGKGKVKK